MASSFTPTQLASYLDLISFPAHLTTPNVTHDLHTLTTLHQHQILHIPYENLSLHYRPASIISTLHNEHITSSPHTASTVDLSPQSLFHTIVTQHRGRGGYCFELAIFFHHVLLALGFDAYLTGARIRLRENGVPSGAYIGWRHCLNIVTLPASMPGEEPRRYAVDVSFGGDGPVKPLPLQEGIVTDNVGMQQVRLMYEHLPEAKDRRSAAKVWIYQYRNGKEKEWNAYYAFSELEFTEMDMQGLCFSVSRESGSFQLVSCLVVKFLGGEHGVYGKVMLAGNEVKKNTGGRTQLVKRCETESERIRALQDHFGIHITDEEQVGIVGLVSELPNT